MGNGAKEALKCLKCGGLLGKWAKRFCSKRCANQTTANSSEAQVKKSAALKGVLKESEHKAKISKALKRLRDEGTLPVMSTEVRQKQAETKRQKYAAMTKEERKSKLDHMSHEDHVKAGKASIAATLAKYGVKNLCEIAGSEKVNAKRSSTMSRKIAGGHAVSRGRFNHGWYFSPSAGKQWYQGSWELARMQALDAKGLPWTKNHGISIPYTGLDNKPHRYVPDFMVVHLDGGVYLEEVKGYQDQSVPLKAQAASEFVARLGWKYQILGSLRDCQNWEPSPNTLLSVAELHTKLAKARKEG